MKKKIYLSAPALICCAGRNRNELYDSCLKGNQNGLVIHEYNGDKFRVGLIEGKLPEGCHVLPYSDNSKILKIIDAALEQLTAEAEKAVLKYGRDKIGVCFGSCENGSEASLMAHNVFFTGGKFPQGYDLSFQSASFPAEYISRKFNITGPCITAAAACASGASAIVRGAELIKAGICGAVIAGGADIVSQTVITGFNVLEAVSMDLCNPFSKNRKGINLGEGAAFFVLDSQEISGIELLGYGESSDAYHMTAPSAEGPAWAMNAAIIDAGINKEQIGYINLHGTGTHLNDKAESLALRTVFKNPPPASSTKPVTGHTLGAAGALETAICWMALNERKGLPVHCWDGVFDEDAPINPAVSGHEPTSICMTNSFAFGGCNVSLILGRIE
ncbi:MAG: 3-oxoacyl-ACP synthase [Treponema sp.]|jgi:3-oxoacyl-[acyl-carrier-protein] synthase-1|nr:3-oxoacyl-ACP synthase [Treponema sp.]